MGSHTLTHCENCGAALQGPYCHACGQSVVSPVRHAAHAIEEVFESFWHLDGRVFRTLRDLLSPGRVAMQYLAGHRVRYLAPLRLFVILSLLTFFVGKLAVHAEGPTFQLDPKDTRQFAQLRTVAEVEQARDRVLQRIAVAEREAGDSPGASPALVIARTQVQGAAAARITELRQQAAGGASGGQADGGVPAPAPEGSSAPGAAAPTGTAPTAAGNRTTGPPQAGAAPAPGAASAKDVAFDSQWDPEKNPIRISWLPDFANRWLTDRAAKAQRNITTMGGDRDALVQAFMGALPTALFVLVPVFALLLKLFYLGSRRLYLEHLTVALYSHAYMLLALLISFLLVALGDAFARGTLVAALSQLGIVVLWAWVPVYLLLMQKRVYAQGWLATTLKYLVIGWVYLVLVTFAAMYALLAGLVAM